MHSPAITRWPLIVLAGALALGSAPLWTDTAHSAQLMLADNSDPQPKAAAAADASAAKVNRHRQHRAHRARVHGTKLAAKAAAPATDQSDRKDEQGSGDTPSLTPTVANAQAQMAAGAADATTPAATTAAALTTAPGAVVTAQTATQDAPSMPVVLADDSSTVVGADELNDVDRAALPEKPTKILRPVPETPHFSNQNPDDTWTQASLIGKVFIILGGCLTLASAARMFVA